MRDKLIGVIKQNTKEFINPFAYEYGDSAEQFVNHLLANGIVVLPCKAGDTVYEIEKNCLVCKHYKEVAYSDCCTCALNDDKLMFECDFDKECVYQVVPKTFAYSMIEAFGQTVFLAEKEAQNELWQRGVRNNG